MRLLPMVPTRCFYSRWTRWSKKGVFVPMTAGLASEHSEETTEMIDATYPKAHQTATTMGVKKGGVDA